MRCNSSVVRKTNPSTSPTDCGGDFPHQDDFKDKDTLRQIDFLFHVILRDANHHCGYVDIIRDQLLRHIYTKASKLDRACCIVQSVLESPTTCIASDGLDEWCHPTQGSCLCPPKIKRRTPVICQYTRILLLNDNIPCSNWLRSTRFWHDSDDMGFNRAKGLWVMLSLFSMIDRKFKAYLFINEPEDWMFLVFPGQKVILTNVNILLQSLSNGCQQLFKIIFKSTKPWIEPAHTRFNTFISFCAIRGLIRPLCMYI